MNFNQFNCCECCGQQYCFDLNICFICRMDYCEKCRIQCFRCGFIICEGCSFECFTCKKKYCNKCKSFKCGICNTPLCEKCKYICDSCTNDICENCGYIVDDKILCNYCYHLKHSIDSLFIYENEKMSMCNILFSDNFSSESTDSDINEIMLDDLMDISDEFEEIVTEFETINTNSLYYNPFDFTPNKSSKSSPKKYTEILNFIKKQQK